jgi:hypothetical protein
MGGLADGEAASLCSSGRGELYRYECSIPFFTLQGDSIGGANCLAFGGSVVVLSK